MNVRIIGVDNHEPGRGQLWIRYQDMPETLSTLTFSILNNQQKYLQDNAQWQTMPHWFTIQNGHAAHNKGTIFPIGPELLDPILADAGAMQITVQLPQGEKRPTTLQVKRDELFSSNAAGRPNPTSGSSELSSAQPVQPVPKPIAEPEPMIEPPVEAPEPIKAEKVKPSSATKVKGKKRLLFGLLALLGLAAAGGAAWWYFGHSTAKVKPVPAQSEQANSGKNQGEGCTADDLNKENELQFVQHCVDQKLDSDKLLAIISAAKRAGKCGVAQRLYANRAQSGDNKVALAYAAEYDPKLHQDSQCFKGADKDTAVYWYQTVLQNDANNALAKARLQELGQ